jgi:hypothetical protein
LRILGWFAPDVYIDVNSDLLSLATLGSATLLVSWRCINNCGAFRSVVNFGLCDESFLGENSMDVHSNIRFLAALMLNVEVLMSYQTSNKVRQRTRHQKRNDE